MDPVNPQEAYKPVAAAKEATQSREVAPLQDTFLSLGGGIFGAGKSNPAPPSQDAITSGIGDILSTIPSLPDMSSLISPSTSGGATGTSQANNSTAAQNFFNASGFNSQTPNNFMYGGQTTTSSGQNIPLLYGNANNAPTGYDLLGNPLFNQGPVSTKPA